VSTTEEPTSAPDPEEQEVEWPEPQEDDGEEHGESLANDGTPGAAPDEPAEE
jgi:hypothetical protein